jgi:short-subunit dehydrogenase
MKCKREAGFANPGPFNDVRNLSATDEVSATVSCPGATATEFADVAGNSGSLLFRLGAASPTTVAREGHAR